MPTVDVLLAFALASAALAVTPGPSVVLIVTSGAEGGPRSGLSTALGLALGTTTWVVVVAAGLGAVLAARPGLLDAVTLVGGTYLAWLAVTRWRTSAAPRGDVADVRRPLREGVVVNLLNPSIAVFLAALVPPFLDLDAGPGWLQVLALGLVLVLVSTAVNAGYGLAGGLLGGRVRSAAGSIRTRRLVAVVYAALATVAFVAALR